MPKFYFDTRIRGEVFRDMEGAQFEDAARAIRAAMEDAKAFGGDRLAHGAEVDGEEKLVRSETGEIVACFTIEQAVRELTKT